MLMLTQYRDAVNRMLVIERGLDERQKIFDRTNVKRGGDRPQGGGGYFKKQKVYQAGPQQMQNKGQVF